MVNGFLGRLQSKLAELKKQVIDYETAIAVGERESRIERGGSFRSGFAAKPPASKKRRRRVGVTPGTLQGFVAANANLSAGPAIEARRLLPLARKQGIMTTRGSLAQAIGVLRRKGQTPIDYDAPMLAHLKAYGPMPYKTVADWFAERYPNEADAQPRKAVALLTVLKSKGKVRLTGDGWWEASE